MKKTILCVFCVGYTLQNYAMVRTVAGLFAKRSSVRTVVHDPFQISVSAQYAENKVNALNTRVKDLEEELTRLQRDKIKLVGIIRRMRKDLNATKVTMDSVQEEHETLTERHERLADSSI